MSLQGYLQDSQVVDIDDFDDYFSLPIEYIPKFSSKKSYKKGLFYQVCTSLFFLIFIDIAAIWPYPLFIENRQFKCSIL